ncbi:MAG: cytochrome c oxidase subunit II, partial [Burkholderiales bacterium]|nr:cytochrome c oxidase subunit II [Burkholderiales bacterium]
MKTFLRLLASGAALLLPVIAAAEYQLNFKPANTLVGNAVYDLHMFTMIIITVIFFV